MDEEHAAMESAPREKIILKISTKGAGESRLGIRKGSWQFILCRDSRH